MKQRSQRYGPGRLHIPILMALFLAGTLTVASATARAAPDTITGASPTTAFIAYTHSIAVWSLPDRASFHAVVTARHEGQAVAINRVTQNTEVAQLGQATEVAAITGSENGQDGHIAPTGTTAQVDTNNGDNCGHGVNVIPDRLQVLLC